MLLSMLAHRNMEVLDGHLSVGIVWPPPIYIKRKIEFRQITEIRTQVENASSLTGMYCSFCTNYDKILAVNHSKRQCI